MNERNKGNRLTKYVPDYVVFDLETTGISPLSDDIIEISALKVVNGMVVEEFSSLINPGRPIPYQATRVNHITDEMVQNAPDIAWGIQRFLEFTGNHILVGHNIHNFDLNFIYDAVMHLYGKEFQNDYIDTLVMSKKCLPQLPSHKLVDIAAYFGLNTNGAHRALQDCIMNQQCYEEMGKLQKHMTIMLCPKCGGEMVRRNGMFGEFYGCSNFPKCRFTKNIR
ncbi:MAG: topoisomerase DNA-binding C4 zinc finger domain-containing protein [Lachnospiraceae bacterium]|nr:topoisomerase DNA-binding C4 zinc finger domain-containing protein [Lachnospiraceae bacterium]